MRYYATYFVAAVTLLASAGAHAASKTGAGNDIVLMIMRLIAPGI